MISRLKSLELIGYKTFASKVNFEFPGRITTIVGPNGSGKSNIADSIRWVLGEQSYRLLRGRKTEDMIFAGSESRSRAGMASASITFDNDDGWLPIDYAEVSITRRAYRDGSNEYLLNGQKIRLRDIQELLAQSGLAERTYTLIGQGLVDAALSIKPEERRKFFEEAAGIGLYRSRREEAINRLDHTRRNLERVQDILSELEPRLRSLERQARRYMEYKTIQADLQVLLKDWYGFHWHRVQKEVSESKKVLREREVRLENARDSYNRVDQKISVLRHEVTGLREQLNIWHGESSAYHKEREQVSRDLAVLEERQRSLTDQRSNFQSDQVRLEEEINSRLTQLESLKAEQDRLTHEVENAQQQYQTVQSQLAQRKQERDRFEQDLRNTRRDLVQRETRAVELNAKINELKERLSSLTRSKEKLESEELRVRKEYVEKKQAFNNAQSEKDVGDEERIKLEKDLNNKSQEIQTLIEEQQSSQKEFNQLTNQLARLRAQFEVLDQAEKSLSGLNQGAKSVLEAARQGGISGRYEALSHTMNVPQEYETAIASALGDYMDAVIIADQSDPEEALHLLTNKEKGRAVLLPLEHLNIIDLAKKPANSLILGRLSDLVNVENRFQPIINLLLGNIFLVENRKSARKLVDSISKDSKLVTLEGEIFSGNGMIIAGKDNRAPVIARPRQKQELAEQIKQVEDLNEKLAVQTQSREKEIARLQEEQKEFRFQLKKLSDIEQQKQRDFHQKSLAYEQARQRNNWIKEQLETTGNQIIDTEKSIQKFQEEVLKIDQEAQVYRENVRVMSRKLEDLPLDELQENVSIWQTNTRVSENARKQIVTRLNEYQEMVTQNQLRLKSMVRRNEDLLLSLQDLDDDKASLRAREQELQFKIEDLRKKIAPSEEKLREIEKKITSLQEEQGNVQQSVSMAERHFAQGQLDFSRNKDSLENLRRRIEEDFGLVAFEYSTEMSGPNPLPFNGLVEQLPKLDHIESELEQNINRQRAQLRRIGPINPDADEEYTSVKERHEFITTQLEDLRTADQDLRQVIEELDDLMQREFRKTFDAVAIEFKDMFTRLFGGGSAKLILTDEENFNQTGIDIEARLPGRREQGLSLLSGGERSLTAVALIFSLLKVSPTPFCVLDEVDAALDEANVGRFTDLLHELSQKIQFIVITHNRNTVQASDVIYGITMGRDSVSQMISLKLDEVSDDLVK